MHLQAGIVKEIKIAVGDKSRNWLSYHDLDTEEGAQAPAQEAAPAPAAAPAASELKEVHVPDIGGDEVEVTEGDGQCR